MSSWVGDRRRSRRLQGMAPEPPAALAQAAGAAGAPLPSLDQADNVSPAVAFSGYNAAEQAGHGFKHTYPAQLELGSRKTRSRTASWGQALTTTNGKQPFHHVARGVDNPGPGQVDEATDADCTEVEGTPPSTQVSPQALPRAVCANRLTRAAKRKAAAAGAPGP